MTKKIISLMGNDSPINGGCEAITKGTIEILKTFFPDVSCIDCFFDYAKAYKGKKASQLFPISYPKRWTLNWFMLQISLRISHSLTAFILFRSHQDTIRKSNVILSVGGDVYSLDYGIPRRFISMGKYIKKQHTPVVIWGASIGPFIKDSSFERKMTQHLKKDIDLILVREEESKKYLTSLGITDNVKVVADPAFIMPPENCTSKLSSPLPSHYICINFSELMAKYVTDGNVSEWIKICANTIDLLFNESQLPILFIPHVKNDYDFVQLIYSMVVCKKSVILIDKKLNAAEMKWIISKAECNIACRTHSTIASFSTSVPTISLGYSIKSKGLNIQMYGHEKFLIYKKDITPQKVLFIYKDIIKNQSKIRQQLIEKNKIVKEQAMSAGKYLKEYLKQK